MIDTIIIALLDESGSMHHLRKDTVGGFNSFIESQKEVETDGEILVYLYKFSGSEQIHGAGFSSFSTAKPVWAGRDLKKVEPLGLDQYNPNGGTALYDALGEIVWIGTKFLPQAKNYIFSITTDGEENASRVFNNEVVRKKIQELQEKGWLITYQGANQDPLAVAKSIGINNNFVRSYTADKEGLGSTFEYMSFAATASRGIGGSSTATVADWAVSLKKDSAP